MTNDHCDKCGAVEPNTWDWNYDGLWLCDCKTKMPKIDFEKLDIEIKNEQ